MAKEIKIKLDENKKELIDMMRKAIQSANLNFLIGAGCSVPAITTLGNVEEKLQNLLDKEKKANEELYNFLIQFVDVYNKMMQKNLDECKYKDIKKTMSNYEQFIKIISNILFERKSNILHKQATIFSTNYDLFIEKVTEKISNQFILNDGFNRSPSLNENYFFSPENFFNTTFNIGNLYKYQVQIPSINLIKLHGSLNWNIDEANTIIQSLSHLKEPEELKKSKSADEIKDFINQFSIVLPKKDKFKETILNQTYYDLLRIYANELDKENTLLIAEGFSFNDEHILDLTKRALKNPTLKLIIFSFNKKDFDNHRIKFEAFNNVDIVYSKSKMKFSNFNAILSKILPKRKDEDD